MRNKQLIPSRYNAAKIKVPMIGMPLIEHVAVVIKNGKGRYIAYHHVADRKNRYGGGLISEPLETFCVMNNQRPNLCRVC